MVFEMDFWRVWFVEKLWGNGIGLKVIVVGQVFSLLVMCIGLILLMFVCNGIDVLIIQFFFNYFLFIVVYGLMLLYRRKEVQIVWYWYLFFVFFDVEVNYLVVKVYQYIVIMSVMLFDCWIILCVLVFIWLVLGICYERYYFVGVVICVVGLVMVIFFDVYVQDRLSGGSNVLFGDIFVLGVFMFYVVLNVSEEFVVKKVDQVEFFVYVGFFGVIISVCQFVVLELDEVKVIYWNVSFIVFFVGFVLFCFGFLSLVFWFL